MDEFSSTGIEQDKTGNETKGYVPYFVKSLPDWQQTRSPARQFILSESGFDRS